MSASTILTLANGKGLDLLEPKIELSDFDALAEHLAKEKRFNGATPGAEYSVAEHCCLGADAILAQSGQAFPHGFVLAGAGYFLVHDLHEALWKDDTTPKKRAIAEIAQQHFGILAEHIRQSFDLAVYRLDVAIHQAAGLQWPPPADLIALIKHFDKILFVTEWRDLMGNRKHPDWPPYANIEPLPETIGKPWTWQVAKQAWARRAETLLPAFARETAA